MAEPAGMSAGRIVEVTRGLIEAVGIEGLSMRKLAAELGVAPTAIYWHVGGRDELLGRVLDQLIAEQPAVEVSGDTARDRIVATALAIRRQVDAAPLAADLSMELGRNAEVALGWQVAVAREVSAAGLEGEEAARLVRAILFVVGGHITLVHAYSTRRPAGAVGSHELWDAVTDPAVDADLAAAMREPADADEVLVFALERLLDGVLGHPTPGH